MPPYWVNSTPTPVGKGVLLIISETATLESRQAPKIHFGCRGAFALFSLLKRQAELGHSSRSLNRSLSQYSAYPKKSSVGRHSSGGGMASVVAPDTYKQRFIESPWTQKVLTVLVCVGVGAIMGDGTPLLLCRNLIQELEAILEFR